MHSDHVQGHSPSHSEASHLDRGTGGEAGHPRHQALCSFQGAEILRARLSYGRRPVSISSAALVDGKQPSGKTKDLFDSAVQKLLDKLGLSLLDAATKSEPTAPTDRRTDCAEAAAKSSHQCCPHR